MVSEALARLPGRLPSGGAVRMALPVRPNRGGFLRPFGTAIFIRDFLNGDGPKYGAVRIDPSVGAPMVVQRCSGLWAFRSSTWRRLVTAYPMRWIRGIDG